MNIDERELEFILLKRNTSNLLRLLSILHYIIGGFFIISISGFIFGIISIIVGIILVKIYKEIPNLKIDAYLFLKNLRIFFFIYTISFIITIIFMIVIILLYILFNGLGNLFQVVI